LRRTLVFASDSHQ